MVTGKPFQKCGLPNQPRRQQRALPSHTGKKNAHGNVLSLLRKAHMDLLHNRLGVLTEHVTPACFGESPCDLRTHLDSRQAGGE